MCKHAAIGRNAKVQMVHLTIKSYVAAQLCPSAKSVLECVSSALPY